MVLLPCKLDIRDLILQDVEFAAVALLRFHSNLNMHGIIEKREMEIRFQGNFYCLKMFLQFNFVTHHFPFILVIYIVSHYHCISVLSKLNSDVLSQLLTLAFLG